MKVAPDDAWAQLEEELSRSRDREVTTPDLLSCAVLERLERSIDEEQPTNLLPDTPDGRRDFLARRLATKSLVEWRFGEPLSAVALLALAARLTTFWTGASAIARNQCLARHGVMWRGFERSHFRVHECRYMPTSPPSGEALRIEVVCDHCRQAYGARLGALMAPSGEGRARALHRIFHRTLCPHAGEAFLGQWQANDDELRWRDVPPSVQGARYPVAGEELDVLADATLYDEPHIEELEYRFVGNLSTSGA